MKKAMHDKARDKRIIKIIKSEIKKVMDLQATNTAEQNDGHKKNEETLELHNKRITTNEDLLVVLGDNFAENDEKQKKQDECLDEHDTRLKAQKSRLDTAESDLNKLDVKLVNSDKEQNNHEGAIEDHEETLKSMGKDLAGVHEKANAVAILLDKPDEVADMTNKYSNIKTDLKVRADQLREGKRIVGNVHAGDLIKFEEPASKLKKRDEDKADDQAAEVQGSTGGNDGNASNVNADGPPAAAPIPATDPASTRTESTDRRRLPANYASMRPSEQALARRRLMNRPNSHVVVLEQLLGEINRLNATN